MRLLKLWKGAAASVYGLSYVAHGWLGSRLRLG